MGAPMSPLRPLRARSEERGLPWRSFLFVLGVMALLLGGSLGYLPLVGGAHAQAAGVRSAGYPSFTVSFSGPSLMPANGSIKYVATASGGPAEQLDGVYTGNYTFSASVVGLNTAGSFVSPVSGAFVSRMINLTVGGLNQSGTYTLELNCTSHGKTNLTQVFSQQFQVVFPYIVSATVKNLNAYTVSGAVISVLLDGTPVGAISVPSLLPSASAQVKYNYTSLGLSPGYHTFTLVLEGSAQLLEFGDGSTSYSVTFYVQGPSPDYTYYYLAGITAAVLAAFISLLFFGPRRVRRKRNP